jgi:hypothetical protein
MGLVLSEEKIFEKVTAYDDDGRQMMAIAPLTLRVRSANNITLNPFNGIKWPEFYCPSSLKQQSIDRHVA